jgi:hypothetical protein
MRGELFLLPLPCGLPYAAQRLDHASPALRPVRALLIRVPLGPRPWLHGLRHRSPGFVRRLRHYYAGVRQIGNLEQLLNDAGAVRIARGSNVRSGSIATGSSQPQVRPCWLFNKQCPFKLTYKCRNCLGSKILPATVPARPAHAFLAHPTRFERVTNAFGALLLTQPAPCRDIAEPMPIG